MFHHHVTTSKKFTLLELLILLAVLAIQMGLLLPALTDAQTKATGTNCINNLKQLVAANGMYATDFQCQRIIFSDGSKLWHQIMGKLNYVADPEKTDDQYGNPTQGVWRCPAQIEKDINDGWWKGFRGSHYGMNYCVAWTNKLHPNVAITRWNYKRVMPQAHKTLLFSDMEKGWNEVTVQPHHSGMIRHSNYSMNAAFCDGHVANLNYKKVPLSAGKYKTISSAEEASKTYFWRNANHVWKDF